MASHYKLILVAVFLAAATAEQMNAGGRKLTQTTPLKKIKVLMNNILEGKENMEVHCQGSDEDFGIQQVPNGEHYVIDIWPSIKADYYCTFLFNEIRHKFDVYLTMRDGVCGVDRVCTWNIKESGPCIQDGHLVEDKCYPWDKN